MKNTATLGPFWKQLSTSAEALLLLDYDGTLAPFRIERDQALPYPGVRELLQGIRCETGTRLVIISGRAVDDLLPLLGLDPAPEIWGCHGWERLAADGGRPDIPLPPTARAGLELAGLWLREEGLAGFSEQKPASLAVHWRGLAARRAERLRADVAAGWTAIAQEHGLELHPFDGGLELRCPGRDKGTAIAEVLAGSHPDCPAAFLGDDRTDEDGFAAIAGRGLGVLVSDAPRPTLAQAHIRPPGELIDFLRRWKRHAAHREKGPPCQNA